MAFTISARASSSAAPQAPFTILTHKALTMSPTSSPPLTQNTTRSGSVFVSASANTASSTPHTRSPRPSTTPTTTRSRSNTPPSTPPTCSANTALPPTISVTASSCQALPICRLNSISRPSGPSLPVSPLISHFPMAANAYPPCSAMPAVANFTTHNNSMPSSPAPTQLAECLKPAQTATSSSLRSAPRRISTTASTLSISASTAPSVSATATASICSEKLSTPST